MLGDHGLYVVGGNTRPSQSPGQVEVLRRAPCGQPVPLRKGTPLQHQRDTIPGRQPLFPKAAGAALLRVALFPRGVRRFGFHRLGFANRYGRVEHIGPAHRFALPEAESIPIALTINELLTNAIKHSRSGPVTCRLHCDDAAVTIAITSTGQLREGFSLAQVPPGVSGLGLVRAGQDTLVGQTALLDGAALDLRVNT